MIRLVGNMLGEFVRLYRKSIGKTMADVSSATGLTVDHIHKVETGRGSLSTLNSISLSIGLEWVGGIAPGPTLGARIKRHRLSKGLTGKELAQLAGVTLPALARVELDRAHISTAEKVLRVLAPKIRARILRHKQPIRIRDIRLTGPDFIEKVRHVMGEIDCDPAANPADFVQAPVAYNEEDDGLSREWHGRVFCNPPFSAWGAFLRKGHAEFLAGRAKTIIMLLPARTGDKSFQEVAGDGHVILLKGRMLFWSEDRKPLDFTAPFPMMVVIFSGDDELIERAKNVWDGIHIPAARSSPPQSSETVTSRVYAGRGRA